MSSTPIFDSNAAKYRCCCRILHVSTGVQIIAALNYIGFLYGFITYILNPLATPWNIFLLIRNNIGVFFFTAIIFGLKKTIPQMFYPCLGFMIFNIFLSIAIIISLVFAMERNSSFGEHVREFIRKIFRLRENDELAVSKEVTEIVIQFILIILFMIFLRVLYRCYQFVRDKKNNETRYAADVEMENCGS